MSVKEVKDVSAKFIEFTCSACGGVIRASDNHDEYDASNDTGVAINCNPVIWPHKCHRCGEPCSMTGSYPRLRYGGQHEDEVWILEKTAESKIRALRAQIKRLYEKLPPGTE